MIKQPMKAPSVSADITTLAYPVYASRKLDGLRAVHLGAEGIRSKTLKRFPNVHVNHLYDYAKLLAGLDGELVVGSPASPDAIRTTTSGVMSQNGEPAVVFWVFDDFSRPHEPFSFRYGAAAARVRRIASPSIRLVVHRLVHSVSELQLLEERALKEGYEGLMIRSPHGPYKQGTATPKEGYLWKLKRFVDGEALLVNLEEGAHNTNAGRTTHKAGMRPANTTGTLIGKDLKTGELIRCAPGKMDHTERAQLWQARVGVVLERRVFTYRHFPTGTVSAPRFPTFQCWRHASTL